MPVTFSEKFLAYLALLSGIAITVVAEYYSILGLTAIFSASALAVIVMGIALGIGKITATLWLKQNWSIAPWTIRGYLLVAISVLMLITSMGIFGFLSKAHSDQSLVSGDVLSKIAVYDEKIQTAKGNIDANRKALKQLDEAVDQIMARSTDEKGADKAVQVRRRQTAERARLLQEIEAEQATISQLTEARSPIAAEVRKVDAEVGPIKYIAQFVYGNADNTILEKAVTWIIITLIVVFDPLAVVLLLASQISFQEFKSRKAEIFTQPSVAVEPVAAEPDEPESVVLEEESIGAPDPVIDETTHPYLYKKWVSFGNLTPMVAPPTVEEGTTATTTATYQILHHLQRELDKQNSLFVQNEEQRDSNLWSTTAQAISPEDYLNISQENLEKKVNYYASLLRNKQIEPKDIPPPLLALVKSRV